MLEKHNKLFVVHVHNAITKYIIIFCNQTVGANISLIYRQWNEI